LEISNQILNNGGVVFGAAFRKDFSVAHTCIQSIAENSSLQGSKYVQSNTQETYKLAKEYLDKGKKVFFTGTPCQIHGLRAYLNKEYENLLTADLICHGVPSEKVWLLYLNYLKKKMGAEITNIFFRDKRVGWKNFSILIKFANGRKHHVPASKDPYMMAFFKNYSLRPICYECPFKGIERVADFALGDAWGIKDLDDDLGTSLVMVHSPKAHCLWSSITTSHVCKQIDIKKQFLVIQ